MTLTLQQHFNLIKEGKGNKSQFLRHAKQLFPQYFNQYTNFDTATQVLKSKQIISEAAGGVVGKGFDIWDWKKILAEEEIDYKNKLQQAVDFYRKNISMGTKAVADKFGVEEADIMKAMGQTPGGLFESVKSIEKETSKEVLDVQAHTYDYKNIKNADNVNFNEIMKGFYVELKDPKNAEKTGDELKDMVVKNLSKDPLYYTKSGEFGVKDLGYTTEAPGLGEPKEPKGKYKSSGYGDLDTKVEKVKANVQDSLGDKEAKTSNPKKVKEMPDKGVDGIEKKMKLQEGNLGHNVKWSLEPEGRFWIVSYRSFNEGTKEKVFTSEEEAKKWIKQNLKESSPSSPGIDNNAAIWDSLSEEEKEALLLKYTDDGDIDIDNMIGNDWNSLPDYIIANISRDDDFLDKGKLDENKSKLRSLIRNIIKEELEEAMYQGPSVKIDAKGSLDGGRRFIPSFTALSKDAIESINIKGSKRLNWEKPHIKIFKTGDGPKLAISQLLLDTIAGSQRGRSKLSLSVSKMGTGITPTEMNELTGEFKKLVKVLNSAGKLSKTGDYYLLDVPTKYNEKRDQYEMPLPNQLEEAFIDPSGELQDFSSEENKYDIKSFINDIKEELEYMGIPEINSFIKNNIKSIKEYYDIMMESNISYGFTPEEFKIHAGALVDSLVRKAATLNEEMNWDKFNIQVSSNDYEGIIKRDEKGWMMYDEDNQPEEAGPFKTLESLMSYYDLIKSDLVGDYVKNLK